MRSAEYGYLAVDKYIKAMMTTQALSVAFKIGLVDYLLEHPRQSLSRLSHILKIHEAGFEALAHILQGGSVIMLQDSILSLTDDFTETLRYRDLLETKLELANCVAPDVLARFHQYFVDMPGFMQESSLFQLFDYGRCHELTSENLEVTTRWVQYTTVLSRYEAQPFADNFDLMSHRKMLDIGGNSGEFAMQLCRLNPRLKADVFDLPVVCSLGESHISGQPESDRMDFISGDLQRDVLPDGYDLILFKSFLHDWPDDRIRSYLEKALAALKPGGKLAIFERSRILDHADIGFGDLPVFLFQYFYHESSRYTDLLKALEFSQIEVKKIHLDTPFMIVSAVWP